MVRGCLGSLTLMGQVCSCHAVQARCFAPPRIPRARYRVTNWPSCAAGPRRRGDPTFWVEQAALAGWQAPRRNTPGGQARHSELAVELVLLLRLVFRLALRQAEGFARSFLLLLGMALPVHTTLSRRGRAFAGRQARVQAGPGADPVRPSRPAHGRARPHRLAMRRRVGTRHHAETTAGRCKHRIGPKLRARSPPHQHGKVALAVQVLNRMIREAKPVCVRR